MRINIKKVKCYKQNDTAVIKQFSIPFNRLFSDIKNLMIFQINIHKPLFTYLEAYGSNVGVQVDISFQFVERNIVI